MTTRTTTSAREQMLDGLAVADERLDIGGLPTAVLTAGEGPPVVLLHGPAADATHWAGVIGGLAADHRVIAPDLPGHGESGAPDGAGPVLGWLSELLARLCPNGATLVGHALGGAIAARLCARDGERVRRLVLVDALGLQPFDPTPPFGAALRDFLHAPTPDTHDALWRQCAHDLDRLQARVGGGWAAFRAANLARIQTPGADRALGMLMAEYGMPAIAPAELARIAVPTTLIWGRHDRATPLAVAAAASRRHGWPLHVIEDCADDPPVERPEALLRALAAAEVEAGAVG